MAQSVKPSVQIFSSVRTSVLLKPGISKAAALGIDNTNWRQRNASSTSCWG